MRKLLIVALVVLGAYVVWVYLPSSGSPGRPASGVGTSGTLDKDKDKARELGAELGEKAAAAGEKIKDATHDAAITTKIKAKMALDEIVKAREIDVSTDGSTVTVSGTVHSRAEHDRALLLARETVGVTAVVDHLSLVGGH
jgi:hyperosmotically inducible periplasmic protein